MLSRQLQSVLQRRVVWCSAILILIFLFWRQPNIAFHPLNERCQNYEDLERPPKLSDCASVEQLDKNTSLAFVEFDDQGAYFDQRQSFAAMRLIRNALLSPSSSVDLFVFVHGWQHNADPEDEHVKQFKSFLLSRANGCGPSLDCNSKRTIGIFVGWPGMTLRPPFHFLTFWSRKEAAHRVAVGAIQEFFATLEQLKKDHQRMMAPAPDKRLKWLRNTVESDNFKTYVIGHSFGGLIAYQANSQSIAMRYGNAVFDEGHAQFTGLGDLLVLINPAIEALRFTAVKSLSSEYPPEDFYSPSVVVVGSRSDWATKFLFPLGVVAATVATNQIRAEQRLDVLTAIGNADSYLTHNAYINLSGNVEICLRLSSKAPLWFIAANPNLIDGHGDLNAAHLLKMFAAINGRNGERTRHCARGEQ